MEQHVDDLAASLKAIQEQNTAIMQAVAASAMLFEEIRPAVTDLVEWQPAFEKSMADLQQQLGGGGA